MADHRHLTADVRFTYPVTLTPDEDDGGFVVTFRDLPEAITQGDTVEECLTQAVDCLEEAIAARISDGEDIPQPTLAKGLHSVACPIQMAIKAALYLSMRESGVSKRELGRRLGVDEESARRLLGPALPSAPARHGTRPASLGQDAGTDGQLRKKPRQQLRIY